MDSNKKIIEWPINGMDRLPREVALDILSRLPVTSLIRFRYASKSWKKLSCDPDLMNLDFSRSAKNTSCLIFRSGNQLHFVEFSDHNEKEIVRKLEPPFPTPMQEKISIVGSCNGMICLSNSKNHDVIHIFNPFTRSYKQLPESKLFGDQEVLVGFGFHPLTNEYKVARIVYYPKWRKHTPRFQNLEYEVQVFTLGSNEWRCIGKIPYQIDPRVSKSVCVNGRFHWLIESRDPGCHEKRIVSFDLADEQFREVPSPDWAVLRMFTYQFAVLGGCLSAVVNPHLKNIEIWIMKDYGVGQSWSKDFEIVFNDPNPDLIIPYLAVQVLCLTKNGGILLKHGKALVSYDPENRELKKVDFQGIPKCSQIIEHVGSLVSIENF